MELIPPQNFVFLRDYFIWVSGDMTMHACMYARVQDTVTIYIRTYVHTYIRTYVRTYIHTYITNSYY